jgi:hypothetical protein
MSSSPSLCNVVSGLCCFGYCLYPLRFCLGIETETPIYIGMYEESAVAAGATMEACRLVAAGECDTAVNW